MNLTTHFDPSRFWLLLKMELFRSRKGVLMTFVVTYGMLFFVDLLLTTMIEGNKLVHEHTESYAFMLLAGGFILSSLAFRDLGSTLKRHHYLTLPVSALERFICMWLLTSVGWISLFTFTYTAYTFIANPLGNLLFNHVIFKPFEPFGEFSISTMKYYFVLQGIFLVGAVHFRGYVLPKTLFVLILFAALCGVITYFLMRDVFMAEHECNGLECELLRGVGAHGIWKVAKGLFWWVLAPLSWLIAYLGIKEQEA